MDPRLPKPWRRRVIPVSRLIRPLLPLVLLTLHPSLPLQPLHAQPAQEQAAEPQERDFLGSWALTDAQNNLFNVRIEPGGKAVSTVGTLGVPLAGSRRLSGMQFHQTGRWRLWGNGLRVDYGDGWSDWIYISPAGLTHASWEPGQSRASVPRNFGPAVRLSSVEGEVAGVYSFSPAQADLPPYTAALLSNGLAFNDIDKKAAGVWRLQEGIVVIDWISGWRTTMSLDPATPLLLRHWAPGTDRKGPPTGGTRQGRRL